MEKLTLNQTRTMFYKELDIKDTLTTYCNEYDKYEYSLNNDIKIVLFIDINTNIVDEIKLYIEHQCLMTIQPYRKLVKVLCKIANKLANKLFIKGVE